MAQDRPDFLPVIRDLSLCRDLPDVMPVLRRAARAVSGADGVTIVLRDGDLCHYADEDAVAPLWKGRRFPMTSCISGWSMLHRSQVAIEDIYADKRIPHDAYRPTFVRSLAMSPIRRDDPLGAIGAYWATQHRATDEELEQLQLLADAAALAITNAQLVEALREGNRQKERFLAALAHELRNPLAPICNAVHIMRSGSGNLTVERAGAMVERQLKHLTTLIDGVLDISNLVDGKLVLRRERFDLVRLANAVVSGYQQLMAEAWIDLTFESVEGPIWIMGDSARIEQVIRALLENAAKFTPSGGRVKVGIVVDPSTSLVSLAVTDTGVGISREMMPHVFEVFTLREEAHDRNRGGLGIGLAASKRIVALHGGSVAATSEGEGRGASFTIQLPRQPELPALAPAADFPSRLPSAIRVLVVEDNRDSADSLRMLLEGWNCSVMVAYNGQDGIKAAQAFSPDVILSDLAMPDMDGCSMVKTLRDQPELARTRIIAITGYGAQEERRRTEAAGFDRHFVKPIDPRELLHELRLPGTNQAASLPA